MEFKGDISSDSCFWLDVFQFDASDRGRRGSKRIRRGRSRNIVENPGEGGGEARIWAACGMEMKREEPRPDELEENPFLWIVCKTGAPRVIITSLNAVVRYCADQMPKKMSLGFLRTLAALLVIVMPRSLTYVLLYPIFRLVFGNLYPAYASYKAVRTKNVKEYVSIHSYRIVSFFSFL